MPREGVFEIVLEGGEVRPGDEIETLEANPEKTGGAAQNPSEK